MVAVTVRETTEWSSWKCRIGLNLLMLGMVAADKVARTVAGAPSVFRRWGRP